MQLECLGNSLMTALHLFCYEDNLTLTEFDFRSYPTSGEWLKKIHPLIVRCYRYLHACVSEVERRRVMIDLCIWGWLTPY